MSAIKKVKSTGSKIHEVYSPFPIHGIDDLLGYKRTRLSVAAFIFGCIGFSLGLLMQSYMLGLGRWRINIGGKNYLAWPDFIPVTFEATVLITSLGMVACFFAVNAFFPGAKAKQPHIRISDDWFCIAIKSSDVSNAQGSIEEVLKSSGAVQVNEEEIDL